MEGGVRGSQINSCLHINACFETFLEKSLTSKRMYLSLDLFLGSISNT